MTQSELLIIRTALRGALGAFDALSMIGADYCLPGFKNCKRNIEEAILTVEKDIHEPQF